MQRWLTRLEQASRRLTATTAHAPANLLARVAVRGLVAMAAVVGLAVLGGALALMMLGALLNRLGLIRFRGLEPGSDTARANRAEGRNDVFDAEYRVVDGDAPRDENRSE